MSWAAAHHQSTGHATRTSLDQVDECLDCLSKPLIMQLLSSAISPSVEPFTAEPLTVETLRDAIERASTEWFPSPHGTEERPHIFSPVPTSFWYDHCIECGMEMTW